MTQRTEDYDSGYDAAWDDPGTPWYESNLVLSARLQQRGYSEEYIAGYLKACDDLALGAESLHAWRYGLEEW